MRPVVKYVLLAEAFAVTTYGVPFSAVVEQGNFFGTQFHPERSSRAGAHILGNFLKISI